MINQKTKIIAVVGPTGSGKTSLGVALAKQFNGEIVSADSRQVYKYLDLSTGKEGTPQKGNNKDTRNLPAGRHGNNQTNIKSQILNFKELPNSKKENNNNPKTYNLPAGGHGLIANSYVIDGIPQHLIDICQPGQKFTLFNWLAQAKIIIEDIARRGKIPIIVGGTGLYVTALCEGYGLESSNLKFKISNLKLNSNNQKSNILNYSRQELEGKSVSELKDIYFALNSVNSNPDLNNPYRLIRAIEKIQDGEEPSKQVSAYDCLCLMPNIERKELYAKIDARAEERFKQGMVEEILKLIQKSKIKNKNCGEEINPTMIEWLLSLGLDIRIITEYLLENGLLTQESNLYCSSDLARTKSVREPFSLSSHHQDSGSNNKLKINIDCSDEKYRNMVERFKFAEHAYARRQLIWWRHHEPKPVLVESVGEAIRLAKKHLI